MTAAKRRMTQRRTLDMLGARAVGQTSDLYNDCMSLLVEIKELYAEMEDMKVRSVDNAKVDSRLRKLNKQVDEIRAAVQEARLYNNKLIKYYFKRDLQPIPSDVARRIRNKPPGKMPDPPKKQRNVVKHFRLAL